MPDPSRVGLALRMCGQLATRTVSSSATSAAGSMWERLESESHEPQSLHGSRSSSSGKQAKTTSNQPRERSSSTLAEIDRPRVGLPGRGRIGRVSQSRRSGGNIAGAGPPTSSISPAPCYLRDDESVGYEIALTMRVATLSAYRLGFPLRPLTVSINVSKAPRRKLVQSQHLKSPFGQCKFDRTPADIGRGLQDQFSVNLPPVRIR
jgi:hypothetical protein